MFRVPAVPPHHRRHRVRDLLRLPRRRPARVPLQHHLRTGPQPVTPATFHRLGEDIGVRLFPLGRSDADAPIAVDELGRLFTVDHGGARLLGESVPEGLTALARGRMPVRLTARERSWTLGPLRSGELLTDAVRVALTGVYVLHQAGAYSAREVRLRATALRGIGEVALDRGFPLPAGSLEAAAVPLVRGMSEALAEAGVRAEGAELRFSVPAPPGTGTGPLARAAFGCVLTVGGSAALPTTPVLTLTAGPGASIGRPAEVFDGVAADFGRFTR
ncbi:SUKH-3 domain-containing protein [Streptomyces sp. NPDC059989]|uniref:SUKH-3 domain-containing protein n=1 Tax=Streptomyces sp. NPDC059989 TaxID=3347026 RepID=UPI003687D40F